MRFSPLALAVAAALACGSAQAQPPPEVAARLHDIGPKIDVAETSRLYAALTPKDLYQGVYPSRDLAYGSDDKQKLDVFTAAPDVRAQRPVLVFVHGGAFVGGDKHAGGALYDNVMAWAARNGVVGVNINYRLVSKAAWPAGADAAAYPAMASMPGLLKTRARLMVTRAELDPPAFRAQTETLLSALKGAHQRPAVLELKDHSHISEMLAVGTTDRSLTDPVLAFIRAR